MALNRRLVFVKGLGTLEIAQVSPTPDTAFANVGYLKQTKFSDVNAMVDVTDETGAQVDFLSSGTKTMIETDLLQTSKAELDIPRNSKLQYHAARYWGSLSAAVFHYFCYEAARVIPGIVQDYKPGERVLALKIHGIEQKELGFIVPSYYMTEMNGPMDLSKLVLWVSPRLGLNNLTSKVLDISGFAGHGTLNSDFAVIWQGNGAGTPAYFLRMDGVNDNLSMGDVVDIDTTSDFMFELWIRFQGANGTQQVIMGKKTDDVNTAGYRLLRTTGNIISFKIADGTNNAVVNSTSTVLINVWKHIAIVGDRNGNCQLYLNGIADGAAVSLAGVTATTANALNLALGTFNGLFGQVDHGGLRAYLYPGGTLDATLLSTIVANHFAADRAFYGV